MGFKRDIRRVALALTLLLGGSRAIAQPPEPLVVTRLPDPDPNFVPPSPEPKGGARRADTDQDATIDQAMQDFGRAIGQAGLVIRQKAEAKCREGIPSDVSAEQRFAYEASCRYQRY